MSQAPELPTIHEAVLNVDTLNQLFEDVRKHARIDEVIVKPLGNSYASETSYSLDDAERMLDDGSASSIQLRYCYEGARWFDTLVRTQTGVRLVRIQHNH